MRFPFVQRKKYDDVVYKLECLLCHATGGKLSKHTYTLQTMKTAVTDYIQESCDEASIEGGKCTAEEIFEEIDKIIICCRVDEYSKEFGYVVRQNYNGASLVRCLAELKKKYTEEQT